MADSRLVVGVHGGGLNGIDTYAEQIALAAASAGFHVTLLAADAQVAEALRSRVVGDGIAVEDLALPVLDGRAKLLERLWPTATARRMLGGLQAFAARTPPGSSWHFNRPALALALPRRSERICVAGWFYPHQAFARVVETWRHVGGGPLRRSVIAAKALDFYRLDQAGYLASDCVVVPTEQLAGQLRAQGRPALACPPPARVLPDPGPRAAPTGRLRFLVCSGDLGHPRKNLGDVVLALDEVARRRGPVTLVAIGRNPEALQRIARRRAPRLGLETLGPLEPSGVRQEMARSDALLFPSRYEEWGYVAVESLLSGTPVVTYPVYPFGEMLSGGIGAVAAGNDPSSFGAAIEHSLTLPRGTLLSRAAAARFGSASVGARLAPLWRG